MADRITLSRRSLVKTAGAATSLIAMPSIILAQTPEAIRFGHLTPRTGFLGPLGEFGVMAADLAVEEINAAGGIMGRKLEILKEDSVNPQTASTKAERMVERDKVACIIGEISSAPASPLRRWRSAPRRCLSIQAAIQTPCAGRTAINICSMSRARTRCM